MAPKILVVDDTSENVDAFCSILKSYLKDVCILRASCGQECLEQAKAELPDVVLLDVHMPGMDGFEVCRILKSLPETQNISVLMVSALMTAGRHRATGIDSGADGYLCKPFDSAELIAQVRALVRLKRYEDSLRQQQDTLEHELQDRTAKLRVSEANWRRLFEEGPDPIFIEDLKGNVLEVNEAACKLHGMTREELLTKNVKDLVPPEQSQHVADLCPQWNRDVLKSYEGFSYTKDKRTVPVEVRARHFEYFGKPAILFHVRDITERLRMEQDLRQAQKLESISLLAGGIAHDFNNILTGVIGNLSLMKLDLQPETPLHEALCNAEESALRAKLLTQQLLTFARGGAPVLKIASVRHLLETVPRFVLSGTGARCVSAVDTDLAPVDMDVCQMSQVIENLVINALQAMPTGGTIRLAAANTVADAALKSRHRHLAAQRLVRLTVEDEGCGIDPAHLTRIFDPYFTTKAKGTGLGLATSAAIVRQHGGAIDVESELGKGSVFTIWLPASEHEVEVAPVVATEPPARGIGRILVMDDDPSILKILVVALTKIGYRVTAVGDGRAALDAYQKAMREGDRFDAVIFDLTVPGGMGGEEAVKLLRAIDPGVKAIVSSGYTDGMAISMPERCGFQAAIEKPYSIQALSQVLAAVLGG